MYKPMKLDIGDKIITRKKHPCGGNTFELTRVGMDIRMKCDTCGKEIWIARPELERRIKKIDKVADREEV